MMGNKHKTHASETCLRHPPLRIQSGPPRDDLNSNHATSDRAAHTDYCHTTGEVIDPIDVCFCGRKCMPKYLRAWFDTKNKYDGGIYTHACIEQNSILQGYTKRPLKRPLTRG